MIYLDKQKIAAGNDQAAAAELVLWGLWKGILLAVSVLVIVISTYQVLGRPAAHASWTLTVSTVCLVWLVTFFMCSYGQLRTIYLFTSAYIVPLCLFHLGIVVPDAVGWFDAAWLVSGPMSQWYERAGWYVALSLGCIGVGFGVAMKSDRIGTFQGSVSQEILARRLALLFWGGLGLLCASAIFLAMGIYSVGNILAYSREDLFRGVGDTRGLGLFLMVFPGALVLLVSGARTRAQRLFAWSLATCSFALIMLSGYRAAALYPLMLGAILWVKLGRRIPPLYAAIAVITVLVMIPAVGKLRSMGAYEEINKEAIQLSVEHSRVQDAFKEMGHTLGVLAHVLELVPDTDPYRYGGTYPQALLLSIPNITGKMRESAVSAARQASLNNPDEIAELPPASWLTYRIAREKFKVGQGVGFSGIGEPYLNFGLAGVYSFFLLLGYLLGRLDQVNLFNHPRLLLFSGAALWPLMRTVRDNFGNFIKPLVFIFIIMLVWRMATHLWVRNKFR